MNSAPELFTSDQVISILSRVACVSFIPTLSEFSERFFFVSVVTIVVSRTCLFLSGLVSCLSMVPMTLGQKGMAKSSYKNNVFKLLLVIHMYLVHYCPL